MRATLRAALIAARPCCTSDYTKTAHVRSLVVAPKASPSRVLETASNIIIPRSTKVEFSLTFLNFRSGKHYSYYNVRLLNPGDARPSRHHPLHPHRQESPHHLLHSSSLHHAHAHATTVLRQLHGQLVSLTLCQ